MSPRRTWVHSTTALTVTTSSKMLSYTYTTVHFQPTHHKPTGGISWKTRKTDSHFLFPSITRSPQRSEEGRTLPLSSRVRLQWPQHALKRFTKHYKLPAAFVVEASADGGSFSCLWASCMTKRGSSICSVTGMFTVQNMQQSASHIKGNIQYLPITAYFNHTSLWVLLLSKFLKLIKRDPYQPLKANHVLSRKQKLILLL